MMALRIATPDAEGLLQAFFTRFAEHAAEGWERAPGGWETDGDSFTLTDPEWGGKAWVRAFPEPGLLVLGLVPAEGGGMAEGVYETYHNRLVEFLLRHARGLFTSVEVTAQVTYPDLLHWTGESQHAPRADRG
jgi:hypothetical protein